jgi:tRNA-splicing ligase RtcB
MSTLKAKDLSKIGYTNDQARSLVINIISKHFKHHSKEELVALLTQIKNHPDDYRKDAIWGKTACTFLDIEEEDDFKVFSLLPETETGPLKIIGGKEIESSAKKQMEGAMSLPITLQGALMPDAHTGYGLPIGGVLAADNAVIPFGVGVDIGCRMALWSCKSTSSRLGNSFAVARPPRCRQPMPNN